MQNVKLGFIGAGNMALSIFTSCVEKDVIPASCIYVSNHSEGKLKAFSELGANVTTDNVEVAKNADIIFLTIKPQNYELILKEIGDWVEGKTLVTVAAGYRTSSVLSNVKAGAYAVRVMPNTPILVGAGATAIADNAGAPDEMYDFVVSIFTAAGVVAFLPEDKMNEIIAVNGSSPAFFFNMVGAIVDAAAEYGIDRDTAQFLAAKTMAGAAEMLVSQGKTARELTAAVTSKGGTTLAALTAFEDYGFEKMIKEAVGRCIERANELGN